MIVDIQCTPVFVANKKAFDTGLYRAIADQGSTRSSKTYSICQLMVDIANGGSNSLTGAPYGKKEISIVSPSLPHLKKGARKDTLEIIENLNIFDEEKFNRTDQIYTFPNGSYIEFFGAEDAKRVRGPGRQILYINEANLLNFDVYLQLALRTTETIFIDFNPADEYSWVYDIADKAGNKLIVSTYKNNLANISKFQIEEIENLKDVDENLWKVYGLGLRGTSSETVYTHWKEVNDFPVCDIVFYGLDYGFNHPSALVKVGQAYNDKGILSNYVDEQLYESKLTNDDLSYLIKSQCGITRSSGVIYTETARPEASEELKRSGLNIKLADKSVIEGIKMVKSMPLYITRRSANVIKEIKSYKWKVDKDGIVSNEEPVKFKDDAMDAMRYAIYTHMFKPKTQWVIEDLG